MQEHSFSDDVAICWARNKKQAVKKFSKLYCVHNIEKYVSEAWFNAYGVAILTDY